MRIKRIGNVMPRPPRRGNSTGAKGNALEPIVSEDAFPGAAADCPTCLHPAPFRGSLTRPRSVRCFKSAPHHPDLRPERPRHNGEHDQEDDPERARRLCIACPPWEVHLRVLILAGKVCFHGGMSNPYPTSHFEFSGRNPRFRDELYGT